MTTLFIATRPMAIDDAVINFSPLATVVLASVVAFLIFSVALDTPVGDFRSVPKHARTVVLAIVAQMVMLPIVTFVLTLVMPVSASIALGMILVASSPPGNISQVLTYRAGGNVALSVSMTAVSVLLYLIALPANVALWGSLNPEVRGVLREVNPDILRVMLDLVLIVLLPFLLGIAVRTRFVNFAKAVQPYLSRVGTIGIAIVLLVLVVTNAGVLWQFAAVVLAVVVVHQSVAFGLGYGISRAAKMGIAERKSVTFEVAIRNATLALGIALTVFGDFAGVALVAVWWGLLELATGFIVATLWARHTRKTQASQLPE